MKTKFDINNFNLDDIEVVEFKPRIFTKDDCKHERNVKFDNTGRIEVVTCIKCGDEVWS